MSTPPGASEQRVYFYTGAFGHPLLAEQLAAAPGEFSYRPSEPSHGAATSVAPRRITLQGRRLRPLRSATERIAIRGLSRAGHVRRRRLSPPDGCALIHSAQHLVSDSNLPYVVDFECIEVFCLYQRVALTRPWARRRLMAAMSDERCRFLLPWSRAAESGLRTVFGEGAADLRAKTVVVPPAIRPRAAGPSRRAAGPLRALFIGTAFEAKGGVESIRAIQHVRATHDVVLDLLSDVPARWRDEIGRGDGITLHEWPASAARVKRLFDDAHVLLFPSHMDTLGFVLLEAMAHGVPPIATHHFAVPELIEDGTSGLVVDAENHLYGEDGLCRFNCTLPPPRRFLEALREPSSPYVESIAAALAKLADDPELCRRLAEGAFEQVKSGRSSIERRRELLGKIYAAAVG